MLHRALGTLLLLSQKWEENLLLGLINGVLRIALLVSWVYPKHTGGKLAVLLKVGTQDRGLQLILCEFQHGSRQIRLHNLQQGLTKVQSTILGSVLL